MVDKFTARGIAIVDDKKVFVIGYAVEVNDDWYILQPAYFTGNHITIMDDFDKVISEPDLCLGIEDIEGKMMFENDVLDNRYKIKFGEVKLPSETDGHETGTYISFYVEDTINEYNSGINSEDELRITGNTHGIADGIKEGKYGKKTP